jgi:hypothetical protein
MACRRFERTGLLHEEEGLLDEHVSTCPDCQEARAAYQRLRQRIAGSGVDHRPPPGWQERVWEAIETRSVEAPARRRPTRAWRLVPSTLLSAAAVAAVVIALVGRRPTPPSLQVSLEAPRDTVRRGLDVPPGTRLSLDATGGGARHMELRVYLNETVLVLRCSLDAPCRREGDRLAASVVLVAVGSYQPVLLVSDRPLPPPSSTLDGDAAQALAAGARVELGQSTQVR